MDGHLKMAGPVPGYCACYIKCADRLKLAPVAETGFSHRLLPSFFPSCERLSLLSWSITCHDVCAHITCRNTGVKKLVVIQKENSLQPNKKLCSENNGELKNLVVYIVFSHRLRESSVGEETTWSGRLFQTGIVH